MGNKQQASESKSQDDSYRGKRVITREQSIINTCSKYSKIDRDDYNQFVYKAIRKYTDSRTTLVAQYNKLCDMYLSSSMNGHIFDTIELYTDNLFHNNKLAIDKINQYNESGTTLRHIKQYIDGINYIVSMNLKNDVTPASAPVDEDDFVESHPPPYDESV